MFTFSNNKSSTSTKAREDRSMPAGAPGILERLGWGRAKKSGASTKSSRGRGKPSQKAGANATAESPAKTTRDFLAVLLNTRRDYTGWKQAVRTPPRNAPRGDLWAAPALEQTVESLDLWERALDESIRSCARLIEQYGLEQPEEPGPRAQVDRDTIDQMTGALTRNCAFFHRFFEEKDLSDLALPLYSRRAAVSFARVVWEYQSQRLNPRMVAAFLAPSDLPFASAILPQIPTSSPEEEDRLQRIGISAALLSDIGADAAAAVE